MNFEFRKECHNCGKPAAVRFKEGRHTIILCKDCFVLDRRLRKQIKDHKELLKGGKDHGES